MEQGRTVYDLLIFDLDGTLIDSVGDIADALNRALGELGVAPHSDAAVARMIGNGVVELVRRGLGPAHERFLEEAVHRYRAAYTQRPLGRTGLYLGVKETLTALSFVDKAVATNKPGQVSREILKQLGVADHFVAILGEDDVGRKKPDPLIVDILRGKSGASRARTLYVGDSLVDADTADAASVDLALVTYGYSDPDAIRARKARHHLDRFTDLKRLLAAA
jgi:phosphoglycolate phosphatase